MPNHSTIPDINSVIYLGHTPNEPLMCPASELSYRYEPHGLIPPWREPDVHATLMTMGTGVYPGWCELGGSWEGGIPGTNQRDPAGQIEAYLRLIGSYGRLTVNKLNIHGYWILDTGYWILDTGSWFWVLVLGPGSGPGSGPGLVLRSTSKNPKL